MMFYVKQEKSKPKLKPKKEREEYEVWLAKHQTPIVKKVKRNVEPWTYGFSAPVRGTQNIPSLNSSHMGVATMRPKKVYTGDKMLGIGTLHKSNAVPVFSLEEAQDIAKMRR
jgi:hypothetical protein